MVRSTTRLKTHEARMEDIYGIRKATTCRVKKKKGSESASPLLTRRTRQRTSPAQKAKASRGSAAGSHLSKRYKAQDDIRPGFLAITYFFQLVNSVTIVTTTIQTKAAQYDREVERKSTTIFLSTNCQIADQNHDQNTAEIQPKRVQTNLELIILLISVASPGVFYSGNWNQLFNLKGYREQGLQAWLGCLCYAIPQGLQADGQV